MFPLAEELLGREEVERLRRDFERADRDELGRAWSRDAAAVLTLLTNAPEGSAAGR